MSESTLCILGIIGWVFFGLICLEQLGKLAVKIFYIISVCKWTPFFVKISKDKIKQTNNINLTISFPAITIIFGAIIWAYCGQFTQFKLEGIIIIFIPLLVELILFILLFISYSITQSKINKA